jgi:VanZ family protein
MNRVPRRWRWGLTALWMIVIFVLSAQTGSGQHSAWVLSTFLALLGLPIPPDWLMDGLHTGVRKLAHVLEYAILALLMAWSLLPRAGYLYRAWLFTVAYAVSDELHQLFVPNRAGTLTDVVVDALGATCALLWLARRSALIERRDAAC